MSLSPFSKFGASKAILQRCFNAVTRVSYGFPNGAPGVFQSCFDGVSLAVQGNFVWFKEVLGASRKFQGGLKSVSREFYENSVQILGLLMHWNKPISYVFPECLQWSIRGFSLVLNEH